MQEENLISVKVIATTLKPGEPQGTQNRSPSLSGDALSFASVSVYQMHSPRQWTFSAFSSCNQPAWLPALMLYQVIAG